MVWVMKKFLFLLSFLTVFSNSSIAYAASPALSAREILDIVDDLFRGESSHAKVTMSVTTAHWDRALTLEMWSKGKDKSLIRILSPKKEKGMTTLRSDNEIWNYLPKVKRVIKLPSSMMSSSWMGSHFTNDDLVKESRMTEDYTFSIAPEPEEEGTLEIVCIPKPKAAVVWGKVVVTVQDKDIMPLNIHYYDEDMNLARIMTFNDFKKFGSRTLPAKLIIVPSDKPNESTVVFYEKIDFNLQLKDNLFSLRTLQR
jgi:outer membrane lipoprotein-sorting protein